MPRFLFVPVFLLVAARALASGAAAPEDAGSLSYGEALYYAYQNDWVETIVRLEAQLARSRGLDKPRFEALSREIGTAAGRFELSYRMHQRAGRAMKAVIEGAVEDPLRNEAVYRLARMYFQKDQPENALLVVERIRGEVPAAIRPDLAFLRANIYLAVGRTAEAVAILKDLQSEQSLEGFSSYNLGIALLRSGSEQHGREYLDRTGRIGSEDPAALAIRDKANLVLGELLLGDNRFEAAKEVLDRVRLSGPFSNRALLSSGWADASQERFEQALVPWGILAGREVTDPAVQEAMLAVPYAYGRLGVYGTAALKYETALGSFGKEIDKLNASIVSIREGKFLARLTQDEMEQDDNWIVKLRELPKTPETAYLLDLMASNDFQESLKNYFDLEQLQKKLKVWPGDLTAFEDIIRRRWKHYQPLLPAVDREYRRLDARMRVQSSQRDRIARQLEDMRTTPRPDLLVTADEQILSAQVARLENLVTPRRETVAPRLCNRIKRLRGLLVWNMYAEYDKRYDDARRHLQDLDRELDALDRRHTAFLTARRTALESYQGHVDEIRRLRLRIKNAREEARALAARQGKVLETMAVHELTRRRDRLEKFRVKARFALADSYDRAGKARTEKKDAQ